MKQTAQNGLQEINTAKIKMNGLDKKKISTDCYMDSPHHNQLLKIIKIIQMIKLIQIIIMLTMA